MSEKKHYFILSPTDRGDDILDKAATYYGEKDYEIVDGYAGLVKATHEMIKNPDASFNVFLMLVGISSVAMSYSDSIYVAKDWEESDYCKLCHALAFSNGLDIVYES